MLRILWMAAAFMLGPTWPAAAQTQGAQSPPGEQVTPGAPSGKPGADRCPEERSAKSIEGNRATSILFQNNRPSSVRIFWIDYQGQRTFYADLNPGQQYVQQTYMTHPWVVTDQDARCLAFNMPERTQLRVDIR